MSDIDDGQIQNTQRFFEALFFYGLPIGPLPVPIPNIWKEAEYYKVKPKRKELNL